VKGVAILGENGCSVCCAMGNGELTANREESMPKGFTRYLFGFKKPCYVAVHVQCRMELTVGNSGDLYRGPLQADPSPHSNQNRQTTTQGSRIKKIQVSTVSCWCSAGNTHWPVKRKIPFESHIIADLSKPQALDQEHSSYHVHRRISDRVSFVVVRNLVWELF